MLQIKAASGKYASTKQAVTIVYGLVAYSFAGSDFTGFEEGISGVSLFFPDGDRPFNGGPDVHWAYQWWYNSIDTNAASPGQYYGKLKWCQDNQNPAVNSIGNWFEMLDAWFDPTNDANGGKKVINGRDKAAYIRTWYLIRC